MDAKAITHFCESPLNTPRAEATPSSRSSAYLIVIRGGMPGTMLRVGQEATTLGRSAENSFPLDDMTVSRRHATIRLDPSGLVTLEDERSTNGTFLNGRRLESGRLSVVQEGDRIQLGSGVVLKLVRLDASEEHFQHELFERTVRDGMTGAYNRPYFASHLGPLSARHAAQGTGLAILMVDVDHFKRINDRHGHLVGDLVLREVVAAIRESTRSEDLVARYGGEEFIIALPCSSPGLATERAEQIRLNVATRPIPAAGQEIRVTVSIGLAYAPPDPPLRPTSLIEAADAALYQAKAQGRNTLVLARPRPAPPPVETQSVEFLTAV